jgi:hypothetical protein
MVEHISSMNDQANSAVRYVLINTGLFLVALAMQGIMNDLVKAITPSENNTGTLWKPYVIRFVYLAILFTAVILITVYWDYKGGFAISGCSPC